MSARIVSISYNPPPPEWARDMADLVFPVVCFLIVSVVCAWAMAVNWSSDRWK